MVNTLTSFDKWERQRARRGIAAWEKAIRDFQPLRQNDLRGPEPRLEVLLNENLGISVLGQSVDLSIVSHSLRCSIVDPSLSSHGLVDMGALRGILQRQNGALRIRCSGLYA